MNEKKIISPFARPSICLNILELMPGLPSVLDSSLTTKRRTERVLPPSGAGTSPSLPNNWKKSGNLEKSRENKLEISENWRKEFCGFYIFNKFNFLIKINNT